MRSIFLSKVYTMLLTLGEPEVLEMRAGNTLVAWRASGKDE